MLSAVTKAGFINEFIGLNVYPHLMRIIGFLTKQAHFLLRPYRPAQGDIPVTIAKAQQAALYRQILPLAILPIATSTLLLISLLGHIPPLRAWIWYGLYLPLPLSLLFLARKRNKPQKNSLKSIGKPESFTGHLTRIAERVSIISGLFWGVATPLFVTQNQDLLVFMTVVQLSHACGFALMVGPLPRMVLRFTALSLIPLSAMLILKADMMYVALGLLTLAVFLAILFSSYNAYTQLRELALSQRRSVRAEALLRASIDAMPDSLAVYTSDGTCVLENANHADWNIEYTRPASQSGERIIQTPEGTWIKCSWHQVPEAGTLIIQSDITSQKQREELLIQAREQAHIATEAQSRFLSRISHELRTPLNSVLGFSELLIPLTKSRKDGDAIKEYTAYIHDAGKHLFSLVDDIIDYTSIGEENSQINIRLTELEKLFKQSVEIGRAKAGIVSRHKILLRLHDDVRLINIDQTLLKRILTHIISNAIKFSATDSKIAISTALNEMSQPTITIRDFGYGMSPEQVKNAFQIFYQADDDHSRHSEGTGMGLAVAKRIADILDIDIKIMSKLGRGTAFILTLPVTAMIGPTPVFSDDEIAS